MKHGFEAPPAAPLIATLRQQNDAFRADIENAPAMISERVIQAFGTTGLPDVLEAVRTFDAFTPDAGDAHDWGAFDLRGVPIYWTIQYADLSLKERSPNRFDPRVTRRVLVLMAESDVLDFQNWGAQ